MEFIITYIDQQLRDDFPKELFLNEKESPERFRCKFRLLDGDGNIYFKGFATHKDSFDPLDYLGAEYGCTDLQYYENGKFLSL